MIDLMKFTNIPTFTLFLVTCFLLTGCNPVGTEEFGDGDIFNLTQEYTINFDGADVYGMLNSPWTPSGANWEIELDLVWDSSKNANTYPIATGVSATSIYIDSSGLPLLKFEGAYYTANISKLQNHKRAVVKFSVSATEVKHYMNGILEKTLSTAKTLSSSWQVIGAHASTTSNFKGKILKISLIDLDDSSNTQIIDLRINSRNIDDISMSEVEDSNNIDFTFNNETPFIKI